MSAKKPSMQIKSNPAPVIKGGQNPPPSRPKPAFTPPASVKKG